MFIRTERLFLRPAWPEDQEDLFEALLEEDDRQCIGSILLPPTKDVVRDCLGAERDPRLPAFMICLRTPAGAVLVGAIGLARAGEDVELRYWIIPHHRGRGYATEAVDALLRQAASLGHRRIVARHLPQADDIRKVYEATGFRRARPKPRARFESQNGEELVQYYVAETAKTARPERMARASTVN